MYDEHEEECVVGLYAVEDEHRLHGEMPRSRSVWRRHQYGDAADDEGYQSAHHAEVACRLKALEREIVVQEVAQPDAQCEGDEERYVLNVLQ